MIASIARQIRRLVAMIALAAMLIGAPYALYKLGGPLLPDHVPGLGEIWQRLTERDTGQVFLGFLVIVGFVAWVIFAITVLLEIASRIAHRPDWRLPGLRLPQTAAGLLVGMLIAGTLTTSAAPAIAASMPLLPHPAPAAAVFLTSPFQAASPVVRHGEAGMTTRPAAPTRTAKPTPLAGPTWTVSKGDSLWSIAEKTLGSGRRYHEIEALNQGRTQPDGRTLDSANFLLPGWILQLPAGARVPAGAGGAPTPGAGTAGHGGGSHAQGETVIVEPGDTLSQIALDELGDANLYPEIAAANHITNPDLIHPGQTIHIPAPQAAPAVTNGGAPEDIRAGSTADGGPSTTTGHPPADDPAAGATAPGASSSGGPGAAVQTGGREADGAVPQTTTGPSSPEAARSPQDTPADPESNSREGAPARPAGAARDQSVEAPTGESASESRHTALLAGATALLAAIAWAGLLFTRRRLEQSRATGQRPRPPLVLEARVDQAMRQAAVAVRPDRVGETFRSATAILADSAPGGIAAAFIGAETIELRPAVPGPPPPPCTGSDDGWILPVADGELAKESEGEMLAALPALVTIGRIADGRVAAINVEHLGALHVSGDPDRCRELINHMTVELSQSPWTDGMQLVLPGAHDSVRSLNPDRIEISDTPAGAALALGAHLLEIRALLGEQSITAARTDTSRADAWEPHILIVGGSELADAPGIENLVHALEDGPASAAALITTEADLGIAHRLAIDGDGMLRAPHLFGDTAVRVAGITDDEFQAMLGLYSETLADAPPDTSAQSAGVDHGGHVNGSRRDEGRVCEDDGVAVAGQKVADSPAVPDINISSECATKAAVDEASRSGDRGTTAPDWPRALNGASGVIDGPRINGADHSRSQVPAGDVDRDLDADLAEWYSPDVRRPRIGILGRAQVTGRGTPPSRRKGRLIEIAVYLALYSRGVSVDKFVSDLWPASPPENVTRRSIVSHLRKWLGTNPSSGGVFLPNADSGYLLVDRLLDSELFTRLVKRSERRSRAGDGRGALDDLLGALALVRGSVFPEAGGFPYSWLALPERMEDRTLPMQIVDAAHNAVDLALAQGDPDGASDAAATARLVDPNSNIPMSDLIRIAEYSNDGAAAATWAKLTLQLNDLDLPEDLPATTRDVVGRALPTPRRQQRPGPRR